MTHEFILWICVAAYALHMIEEKVLDWKKWSESKMGHSRFDWSDFYIACAIRVVVGFSCAMVGWQAPAFALMFPAFLLWSAVFSHLVPSIKYRKSCPGLITTLLLFFPIGIWTFWGADNDVVLTPAVIAVSLLLGAFLKWAPRIFIRLNKKLF